MYENVDGKRVLGNEQLPCAIDFTGFSCYACRMVIEQTVEIPANRRLVWDLPPELPTGRARAALTLTFEEDTGIGIENDRRLSAQEALKMGRGIAKRLGSKLSSGRFLEMRHQDRILEDSIDARARKERMQKQGDA
jgi:hypothetical protein